MRETTTELKKTLARTGALLRTLRDEARVDAHLAGMDARDGWKRIEKSLVRAEHAGRRAADEVARAVDEIVRAVKTPAARGTKRKRPARSRTARA